MLVEQPLFLSIFSTEAKKRFLDLLNPDPAFDLSGVQKATLKHPSRLDGKKAPAILVKLLKKHISMSVRQWRHLAPASQNRKQACLKAFLKWLFEEGIIAQDLHSGLRLPTPPQKLPYYLSVDEALNLVKTLQKAVSKKPTADNKRDLLLIYLLYGGGLRVSEACQLKWNQVEDQVLRLKGKGGRERLCVLPDPALKDFKAYRPKSCLPQDLVLGLTVRKAYDRVRYWGVQTGLNKPLSPHILRHSFATHLLSSGSNLRSLQELLGHRSLSATQKYTHLNLSHLAQTLEKSHPLHKKDS